MDPTPLHNPLPSDRLTFGELAGMVPELRMFFDQLISVVHAIQGLDVDRNGLLGLTWANGRPLLNLADFEELAQYVVLQEFNDYLLCAPFTQPTGSNGKLKPQLYDPNLGQSTNAPLYIAKPYVLQQTPWNGKTVAYNNISTSYTFASTGIGQRTATDGSSNVFNQVLSPDYFPGDVIVAWETTTGYQDPNGNDIVWMDLNTAARAWITLCP